MIDAVLDPLRQVPWVYVFVVLIISVLSVFFHSRSCGLDSMREAWVFLKGIAFVLIVSAAALCTVAVLKYMSYLKIDIMQLSSFEFFVVVVVFGFFLSYSFLFRENKRQHVQIFGFLDLKSFGKMTYPAHQAVLYLFMVAVVSYFNDEIELFELLVSVIPVNVLYHLYFLGMFDRAFIWILGLAGKCECFADAAFFGGKREGRKYAGKNKEVKHA
ncbi:MAG: hypothetical protein U9P44_01355 [archaeon]|nr:hypothetical protein [archaeon]